MQNLVERARDIATTAHTRIGHRRKYSNQPYGAPGNGSQAAGHGERRSRNHCGSLVARHRRGHAGHPDAIEAGFGAGVAGLIDCLQLSNKGQILMETPALLRRLGFASKRAARRVVKEQESLRNHLAHAQDIVIHDRAQIARLTRRVEEANGE
jgi:hypothetical protein